MNALDEITRKGVRADVHVHTNYSDGEDTLKEMVEAAVEKGLACIGFCDHVWESSDWVGEYVEVIDGLRQRYDITILAGCEAKAVDLEGNVDVKREDAERLDYVMGVVHRRVPGENLDLSQLSPGEAARLETEITLSMLDNSIVDVIGHPMRTYYKFHYGKTTDEGFPEELMDEMVDGAVEAGKPLEVNLKVPAWETLSAKIHAAGAPYVVGSDAHGVDEFKNADLDRINEVADSGS